MTIDEYRAAVDSFKPRTELKARIAANLQPPARRSHRLTRTAIAAVIAAALLSVGALTAAAFGGLDWLREKFDPQYLDATEPVGVSVTDEGIEFGVMAAQQYGDEAVLYLCYRDTTGAGRITADMDVFPDVVGGYSHGIGGGRVMYDPESGTAVQQIRVTLPENVSFENSSLTLRVTDIFYGREEVEIAMPGFDLAAAVAEGEHIGAGRKPGGSPDGYLTNGHLCDIPGTGHAYISAAGVIDGFVTVQVEQSGTADSLYLFSPYLTKENGSRFPGSPSWKTSYPGAWSVRDSRFVFDMDESELPGWTLNFSADRWNVVRGNWEITVNFGETPETLSVSGVDVRRGDTVFEDVTISLTPLGLTMEGEAEAAFVEENLLSTLEAWVITPEGELPFATFTDVPLSLLDAYEYYEGKPTLRYYADWDASRAIDISSVTAVRICDTVIEFD